MLHPISSYSIYKNYDPPPMNVWVVVTAPVRIDLAGGWSDTPPIAYEHGGKVVNLAVKIDGKVGQYITNHFEQRECKRDHTNSRQNKATSMRKSTTYIKVTILPEKPELLSLCNCHVRLSSCFIRKSREIILTTSGLSSYNSQTITSLSEILTYSDPTTRFALLKACLICSEVICETGDLNEQLEKFGGGVEIVARSDVPQGSGLGVSSILAGTLLIALAALRGRVYDSESLIYAVLKVEQMMTTGGGWQDQVGGLIPGIKYGYSEAKAPLTVSWTQIPISPSFLQTFESRLVLIYTGKSRLAKNLLNTVIERWRVRDADLVKVFDQLTREAESVVEGLRSESLTKIGTYLSSYHSLKHFLSSPNNEPPTIPALLASLNPLSHGLALCGAGGGGFLFALLKEGIRIEDIQEIVKRIENDIKGNECTESVNMNVYRVQIDFEEVIAKWEQ
ncbi:1839_t:CDS:2 [Paraglomus occultum]|uniref:1839_t:CDS:1 n=1 Tax=Paraglomus occultum TaxID=144539 RepID=A0A9N9DNG3_9GLOM|nr:1839_t:CDS:2 [Paraglomus occultum]